MRPENLLTDNPAILVEEGPPTPAVSPEFADLYDRHSATVYAAALRVTGRPADAEDVLQTVFLRLLHHGSAIDEARSPEAYLKRAAANASIDLLRQRASRAERDIDSLDPRRQPPAGGQPLDENIVLKQRLRAALATLDPEDAALFTLRYLEGMSNIELARIFDLERGTVATRLHRIRHTLQHEVMR
jgi:RNA polymerase sigma-70 factor (ECF subfamily)